MLRTGAISSAITAISMLLAASGVLAATEPTNDAAILRTSGVLDGLPSADAAAIRALLEGFTIAWSKSDAHGLAMFWAPAGDFINPDGFVMKGRTQIESFYAQAFSMGYAGSHATATIDMTRHLTPDIVVIDGTFGIAGAVAPDHQQLPPEQGRFTTILRKKSGHWWIISNREMEAPRASKQQSDQAAGARPALECK